MDDSSVVRTAVSALDEAMREAGAGAFFQSAEQKEIDEVFGELRESGLEPSEHLAELYFAGNPLDVTINPWIYGELELIPARFLFETHEEVALSTKRKQKVANVWRGHWIVIARAANDPYIVNAAKPELPVFTDTHGHGAWRPQLVSSSLTNFLWLCRDWVDLFVGPGLHPEPESYRDVDNIEGEVRSRGAWRELLRRLTERDADSLASDFWLPRFED